MTGKRLMLFTLCLAGLLSVSWLLRANSGPQAKRVNLKFDFGPGHVASGYTQVLPSMTYTKERGYGFEPGATVTCVDLDGKDALRGDFCKSDKPFFFSVTLPEGNYNVTLTF